MNYYNAYSYLITGENVIQYVAQMVSKYSYEFVKIIYI